MPIKSQSIKSVLTTPGDMVYVDATGKLARLPIGATNATLGVTNNLPSWSTAVGGAGPGPNGSSILDSFTRANAATLGANWTADITGQAYTSFQIVSNAATPNAGAFSNNYWNTSYGPNCEAFVTIKNLGTQVFDSLMVRLTNQGTTSATGYSLEWDNTNHCYLFRIDPSFTNVQLGANIPVTIANGYRIGLSIQGSTIKAWVDSGGGWTNVGTATDTAYAAAGKIGMWAQNDTTSTYTNFGGGSI